ncbi:MAG: hypothetical protein M3457_14540 [Chloroflexota bacterium]|nr:hypothetical protein [Chloroflexota bacterium]
MESESSIEGRITWPANHRAALVVVVHVDAPDLELRSPPRSLGLDYSATGLQRLLKVLADLDVSATTAWSATALASYPQLARLARDGGHELALSHALGASTDQQEVLLSRILDVPAIGLVESLPMKMAESVSPPSDGRPAGLSWVITGAGGDVPVLTVESDQQSVASIPVSPYWIDSAWLAPERPLPPSSLLEAWSLGLAEVRSDGGLMVVVLHPSISGRPGFSSQIERFLDEAIESGDVWIANAAQVAEWSRQEQADRSNL